MGSRFDRRLAVLCLVAGVVMLFAAGGLYLAARRMSPAIEYTLISGIALLVAYGILSPTAVLDLVRSRQARFGSLSLFVTAVVLGVLVMANVLAAAGTRAVDLTRSHLYTLSPKSVAVVRKLDSDLAITGVFRPNTNATEHDADMALLAEYQRESPHVKVTFINPDQNQTLVQQLGVKINGALAIQYKDRAPVVLNLGSQAEQDITGAILKLEQAHTPLVCWASAEGEPSLQDTSELGYSGANDLLAQSNYATKAFALSSSTAIPKECDVVALVGPQQAIAETGVKALQAYLAGGGRMLVAVDPWSEKPVLDSVNSIFTGWGVGFDGGLVVEPDPTHSAKDDTTTPVVFDYGNSPISKGMANRGVFFPQATAVTGQGQGTYSVSPVAQTTKDSYLIPGFRRTVGRAPADRSGPFTILATVENTAPDSKSRVVLYGTPKFAVNVALPPAAPGFNNQLMLNSLDWVTGQDELIALQGKPPARQPLLLTDQDLQVNGLITLVLMPLAVVLGGVAVWLRRRSTAPNPA